MILELGDGRELKLPDEMPDETARQLKALILALEERARIAESAVRLLQDEMAALRNQTVSALTKDTSVAEAIAALCADIDAGFAKTVRAQLADTVIIKNEVGDPVCSRKVVR